jgi:hypothetical protein
MHSRADNASLPWTPTLLLAGGSLVIGAASPLYDLFVPTLLQRRVSSRGDIGAAMGIDNVPALFLVPLAGTLGMAVACLVLQIVPTLTAAVDVLLVSGFAWSLPLANLIPMALELGTAAPASDPRADQNLVATFVRHE